MIKGNSPIKSRKYVNKGKVTFTLYARRLEGGQNGDPYRTSAPK